MRVGADEYCCLFPGGRAEGRREMDERRKGGREEKEGGRKLWKKGRREGKESEMRKE